MFCVFHFDSGYLSKNIIIYLYYDKINQNNLYLYEFLSSLDILRHKRILSTLVSFIFNIFKVISLCVGKWFWLIWNILYFLLLFMLFLWTLRNIFSLIQIKGGVEIRLFGGSSPADGRVDIKENGQWGSLCDNNYGLAELQVICNTLGYR